MTPGNARGLRIPSSQYRRQRMSHDRLPREPAFRRPQREPSGRKPLATRRRAVKSRPRSAPKNHGAKRASTVTLRPARPAAPSRVKLRALQHAAIAALGERALAGLKPVALMDEAVERLRTALEVEYVKVCELVGDGPDLIVRAGSGWMTGPGGSHSIAPEGACQAPSTQPPLIT